MRTSGGIVTAMACLVMTAASVNTQAIEKQPQINKSEVVMKAGNVVSLFHSGTADVKKEICLDDTLPVYRQILAGGHTQFKEVGTVKVTGYEGEQYFKAEVVSGEIKVGDIAKKGTASCLIQGAK